MWLYGAAHPVMFLKRKEKKKGREGRKEEKRGDEGGLGVWGPL